MGFKIKRTLEKNRKNLIVFTVVWLVLSILLVMPLSCAIVDTTKEGAFYLQGFIEKFLENIGDIFSNIGKTFTQEYLGTFFSVFWKYSIIYFIFVIIGLVKTSPRNEYTDIEHGSSDWCKSGEQYRTLSSKKGIILAEDNYLPLDKRGNINVLVVGRIWFW